MAEGIARHLAPRHVAVSSAGSKPASVNPMAVQALCEIDIHIDSHWSKDISSIDLNTVSHVIALCSEEVCPVIDSAAERLSWVYPDPASAGETAAERMNAFRTIRDDLLQRMPTLLNRVPNS